MNPTPHHPDPRRRIAISIDLSDESAFAVQWAVDNYLRPNDHVILLHVSPTPVLYGADWGAIDVEESEKKKKALKDLDATTVAKLHVLATPLIKAGVQFKTHIVKDHDMKERICLEIERLGTSAVIMGSRGIGAARSCHKGGLGSVSDYCVHHCMCPVVVVRCPEDRGAVKAEPVVVMHSGSEGEESFHGACECRHHSGEDDNDGEEEEDSFHGAKAIKVADA